MDILIDHSGKVWIATNGGGISLYNPKTNSFQSNPVDAYNYTCLFEDNNHTIWGGSIISGLIKLEDKEKLYLKLFKEVDGLSINTVKRINEDSQGKLWLTTDRGISVFDPVSENFQNYYQSDGLPYNNLTYSYQASDGRLWVANKKSGFFSFHPDSITSNHLPPKVVIKGIKLFDEPIPINENSTLEKDILFTKKIKLAYWQNDITLEFAALHFKNPKYNRYLYILENYDENWRNPVNQRSAKYTNLDPGDYTFRVKASNSDGIWNEEGASLEIIISPPWWATWWAYILYVLVAAFSVFTFIRWRTNEQAKELERQRTVNKKLLQVDKLKDQFLANTSHELRTPLQGIIGLSESLIERVNEEEEREDINMIISSGKRLNNLVNDILDFSKLQNQDLNLQLRPVDMKIAVDVVFALSIPLLKGKSLQLVNSIPKDAPFAHADENSMQQILHNLIGNAIKFSDKGTIEVSGSQENGSLSISVKDQGIGIPIEKQEAIFQSFEQLEESDTREYGGTGLGLSVTKQLIELHGGTISVDSKPGEGSYFSFSLPVSSKKRSAVEQEKLNASDDDQIRTSVKESEPEQVDNLSSVPIFNNSDDKIKILVVDDEPINRKVLQNHLSKEGFEVVQAIDGLQALEIVKKDPHFDLIILDIMMPKMSGYEVCHKLRDLFLPSELPVVMLTAKNRVNDLVEGFSAGANDYLTKPFSKNELLSRIKTHLNLHRINKATGKFVPFEFLRAVGRDAITDVRLGDHAQKEVTVFFSDIRDYTTLAETMSPKENFSFINDYVGKMGPIIRQNKGFINQYLGDGIMAIFPKELDFALAAAIAMQLNIQENISFLKDHGKVPISVGMGLHVGSLVMGIIGDNERNEPTTISDTVNAASRMEGLTKYYGANIIVSSDCINTLKNPDNFHFRYLGKVQVKGKSEAINAYECFDGDKPKIRDLKLDNMNMFNEGMEHFYAKDFAEASAYFARIAKANPNDKVAQYFRIRAARHTIDGVSEDWDGIEKLEKK